jgi:hypothetical protein
LSCFSGAIQLNRAINRKGKSVVKRNPQQAFDAVLQIVKQFSQGASLEDILQARDPPLPTLQRYLAFLTAQGRLNVSGRSRQYHVPATEDEKNNCTATNFVNTNLVVVQILVGSIYRGKVRKMIPNLTNGNAPFVPEYAYSRARFLNPNLHIAP